MRMYVLYVLLVATMAWGVRNWFACLCGVIAMSALMQHDDMPRAIAGIPGFNLSNLLLAWTMLFWLMQRAFEKPAPRLAAIGKLLLISYVGVVVMAWFQGVVDLDALQGPYRESPFASLSGFTIEYLINPIKYMIPAVLLYDGLRSRRRLWMVLAALGAMSLLYAVIVIKNIPISTLMDEEGYMATRRRIQRQTGLHANDMALVMTQAVWAMAVYFRFCKNGWLKVAAVGAIGAVALADALCHSRGGYVAFVATGLVLGVICWRRLLLFLVPATFLVCVAFPTIPARVLTGLGVRDVAGAESNDWDTITAGRTTNIWPPAMAQIAVAPALGAGRLTILRTDMYDAITEAEGACPTHPHNAYLEMWCDGGAVSLLVFLTGMAVLTWVAVRMSRDPNDTTSRLVGGICLATLVPLGVMALSGQSFWPRENVFPTACVIAVAVRLWTLRTAADRRLAYEQTVRARTGGAQRTPAMGV